jgi:hypothetical protein
MVSFFLAVASLPVKIESFPFLFFCLCCLIFVFAYKDCIFVNEVGKSGSKGSLFGGLTGAALMGTVTFA